MLYESSDHSWRVLVIGVCQLAQKPSPKKSVTGGYEELSREGDLNQNEPPKPKTKAKSLQQVSLTPAPTKRRDLHMRPSKASSCCACFAHPLLGLTHIPRLGCTRLLARVMRLSKPQGGHYSMSCVVYIRRLHILIHTVIRYSIVYVYSIDI